MEFRIGKKMTPGENVLDINNIKKELKNSIYEDIKYDNEDSAKKLAVKQGMDYDNFKQMVLGANIKPIKSQEIMGLYNGVKKDDTRDNNNNFDDLFFKEKKKENKYQIQNKEVDKLSFNLNDVRNYKEFENTIIYLEENYKDKNMSSINFLDTLLENLLKNDLNKIITINLKIQYFLKIIEYYLHCNEIKNYDILISFLNKVTEIKKFKLFKSMFKTNDIYIIKLWNKKVDISSILKKFQ